MARAIDSVSGFAQLINSLQTSVTINQLSPNTFRHYSHQLAKICLHFGCLPVDLSQGQIDQYLAKVINKSTGKSAMVFKQTVFGLKYYFKHVVRQNSPILPTVITRKSLPVVLSQAECKRLFIAPKFLKHRIILSLIYSAGLRISEATKLKLSDVDFDRMTITVRNGKGNKDRCLPLSKVLSDGLKKYLTAFKPKIFLINSYQKGVPYSVRSIQNVMKQAVAKAGIDKPGLCVHSLRHSFATHMIENGVNIVTIQAMMGHAQIQSTLVYLQLVTRNLETIKSPLDSLYGK